MTTVAEITPDHSEDPPGPGAAFAAHSDAGALREADEVLDRLVATSGGRSDPYPHYRRLRELAPFYRSGWDGLWYASRYDDCKAVLLDPRCGRGETDDALVRRHGSNPVFARNFRRRLQRTMLMENPPEHTRLRGVVSRAFTPRRTADLRSRIAERVDGLLDQIAAAAEVDLMRALAFPLPVAVIGDLVGVPADEREQFRDLARATQAAAEPGASQEVMVEALRAGDLQESYFVDLVARKRRQPGDDLLSALIELRDAGGALSEEEMVATARLLFGAGFVTTTNLIGNGMLTLFRNPDEMHRLWEDPGLAQTTVEEILRYESPVQMNGRAVLERLEVGGQQLEQGDIVVALVAGANRDPGRFADPERFDVGRQGETPLSFGWGIHHCLGAPLARLEGEIVFTKLVERFASVELAGPEPEWTTSFLRGVANLPVRVVPR
ncbi:MAG: cytochrome P450 [Acidimicrobiia bacterium]